MRTRRIGGAEVSALGIGAMSFSGFYAPPDREASFAVLDEAMRLGIDHVDTANIYGMGESEETLGAWMASRGARPFIATKAGITRDPDRPVDNAPAYLEAELDGSLRRLGVERVDLFYAHRLDAAMGVEAATEALAALVAKGKAAAIGFSEIAPTTLERARAIHPVAAVQSEYSLQTRLPELGLTRACERTGTALVAFSPVGRGLLTDAPITRERAAASAFLRDMPRFSEENMPRNHAASAPLRRIAAEAGIAAAGLAIAWLLDRSPSVVAIPGTRSVAHLRDLAAGAAFRMTDELRRALDREMPPGWCHGARYTEAQAKAPEDYC